MKIFLFCSKMPQLSINHQASKDFYHALTVCVCNDLYGEIAISARKIVMKTLQMLIKLACYGNYSLFEVVRARDEGQKAL